MVATVSGHSSLSGATPPAPASVLLHGCLADQRMSCTRSLRTHIPAQLLYLIGGSRGCRDLLAFHAHLDYTCKCARSIHTLCTRSPGVLTLQECLEVGTRRSCLLVTQAGL